MANEAYQPGERHAAPERIAQHDAAQPRPTAPESSAAPG